MSEIDNIVKQINSKFKTKVVITGNDLKRFEFIPYSSPKMNYITRGGIPEGKMLMFAGTGNSGKTTTALDGLAQFQKKYPNRLAVYVDAENTLDKEWGTMLGVDWNKVILIQPEHEDGETVCEMVLDLIKSGNVGFVVIDSCPFLIPKAQYEEGMDKKSYGGNSGLITQFCGKVIPLMNKYNTTVIMVNQVRDKFGVTYTAYNLPCGRQLYHSCIQVLMFSKGQLIDVDGNLVSGGYETPIGNIVNVKMEKNKATKSDRRFGDYRLSYYYGVDTISDTVDLAIFYDLVMQGGSWYSFADEQGEVVKYQGKPKLFKALKENTKLFDVLHGRLKIKMLE